MWKPSVNAIWLRAASRFDASVSIGVPARKPATRRSPSGPGTSLTAVCASRSLSCPRGRATARTARMPGNATYSKQFRAPHPKGLNMRTTMSADGLTPAPPEPELAAARRGGSSTDSVVSVCRARNSQPGRGWAGSTEAVQKHRRLNLGCPSGGPPGRRNGGLGNPGRWPMSTKEMRRAACGTPVVDGRARWVKSGCSTVRRRHSALRSARTRPRDAGPT